MTGLVLLGWAAGPLLLALVLGCWPRRACAAPPVGTTTPDYRHAGGDPALPIPEDGAELGYRHPLGYPVRVVRGIPVAVGWTASTASWRAGLVVACCWSQPS